MKINIIKFILLVLIVYFSSGQLSFSQFKSREDLGDSLKGIYTNYYAFTNDGFWCLAKISSTNGLFVANVDNDGIKYYKFDTVSLGKTSDYCIQANKLDSSETGFLYILETKGNDVWLINAGFTNYLLRINKDNISNYKFDDFTPKSYQSYFCDSRGNVWLHFKSQIKDSTFNYIYCFENERLVLKHKFISSFTEEKFFFILGDRHFYAEQEYINNKYFYSIYELINDRKELLERFEDDNQSFYYSSHYLNNNELYILKSNGDLLKINDKNDVTTTKLKIKERYPASQFFILNDEFIYMTHNHLNRINLINKKENKSEFLGISDKCKSAIYKVFLSRDNYFYCSLMSNESKENMIIDTKECIEGINLKIIKSNF